MGFMSILGKIFGDANEKYVKSLQPLVDEINAYENEFEKMSDEGLKNLTVEFRRRLGINRDPIPVTGIGSLENLDDILPEAFAAAREAAKRTLNQRHFDVQLIGGMVLHGGNIAEMRTGEGKTLVATLSAYLNALPGKGVHIVTVNDYLAKIGGNIGYYIRPSARKKGYGTKILELALIKAKQIGLQKILVTCDESNIASKKIIEKNKGQFQDKVISAGEPKLRYWIDL